MPVPTIAFQKPARGLAGPPQPPAVFAHPQDNMRRAVEFTQRALKGGHCCALCSPFMAIPPVLHTDQGSWINPTFDALKVYHLAGSTFPEVLSAGATQQMSLVVPAEENEMGDLLVSELMSSTVTDGTSGTPSHVRTAVMIKSQQNDKVFMNAPVLDRFVFTTAQFRRPLPCCFLIQATNFAQFSVKNIDAATAVDLKIVARGQRFLPYQNPELREELLAYWNANRSTPYWLTIDLVQSGTSIVQLEGGGVQIPAAGKATCFMTVPGAGDFQLEDPLCLVEESTGLFTVNASDIDILIVEGVGRQLMSQAVPLGDFVAQPNRVATPVAAGQSGFQGDEARASSGGHGLGPSQFFKRNTRVRVELTNNSTHTANVWFTCRGCMHYYEACPPDKGLSRSLSLEPLIGPMLTTPSRCPPVPEGGYAQPQGYQLPGYGAPAPYGYPPGFPLYQQPAPPQQGMQGFQVQAPDGGYGGRW